MKKLSLLLLFLIIYYNGQSQTIDTLVNVGSYKLHFKITKGKGTPIVFEAGGGDDGSVWNDLLKTLKDSVDATLITYDRQGMGTSGIDTSKTDILNEVKGLEIGLAKLGYAKNLIFVSHSLGGSYSILYSSRNKKQVKGCVFIDINLPCFMTTQKTKEIKAAYADEMENLKRKRLVIYYLLSNYEETNNTLRATKYPANIPATVISSDFPPYKGVDSISWKQCQKSFGTMKNHRYVLANNCGHYVFKDNPGMVISEIKRMYNRTKKVKMIGERLRNRAVIRD